MSTPTRAEVEKLYAELRGPEGHARAAAALRSLLARVDELEKPAALGAHALSVVRERRAAIEARPQEYELQVALGFDDIAGAAQGLGLLGRDGAPA